MFVRPRHQTTNIIAEYKCLIRAYYVLSTTCRFSGITSYNALGACIVYPYTKLIYYILLHVSVCFFITGRATTVPTPSWYPPAK